MFRLAEDKNPVALRRSSLFPNLALLFNRYGYEKIWKGKEVRYSTNGWDHWIRSMATQQGYECIYPAYPRVTHTLYDEGTTTTKKENRKVGRITMYSSETPVLLGDLSYLLSDYYDLSLLKAIVPTELIPVIYKNMQIPLNKIIDGSVTVDNSVNELFSWDDYRDGKNKHTMVISYMEYQHIITHVRPGTHPVFKIIITNEVVSFEVDYLQYYRNIAIRSHLSLVRRGFHKGILFYEHENSCVFMIDKRDGWYALPADVQSVSWSEE